MYKWLLLFSLNFLPIYSAPIDVPNNLAASDAKNYFTKQIVGQHPFPTELTFAAIADHRITCTTGKFDPSHVKAGDSIYVMDWYIEWFLKNVQPLIKNKYILITGDSAGEHPGGAGIRFLYSPKVAAWFTRNLALSNHPKLFNIPKGQSIYQWGGKFSPDTQKKYLDLAALDFSSKVEYPLMYLSFTARNHSSRETALSMLKDAPFCFCPGRLPIVQYYQNLASHKFVLCPRGVGMDTVRFWEAVGLNTIPVVEHSLLDELYEGTPCVFVYDLSEITEKFLVEKFKEVKSKIDKGILSKEKAFIDYWIAKINYIKQQIKAEKWEAENINLQKFDESSIKALSKIFDQKRIQECLFIYGAFTGVRPYQLASKFDNKFDRIMICDKYAYNKSEQSWLISQFTHKKMNDEKMMYTAESVFKDLVHSRNSSYSVFMDLTHQYFKFTDKLGDFLDYLPAGSTVAGNMKNKPYVMVMLKKFEIERKVTVKYIDNFWYITK